MRGTMKVCAVKAPDFGERRKLILEDIATITGGQVFSKEKGMKLDKFSWDWFGSARTVTVSKETTTIVDGEGDDDAIIDRADDLQKQIDKSTTPYEKEQLQNRLAKFVGGVAIIHVGGATETEMLEKLDRVEDALHATRAAIEEGIVVGGGAALLWSRTNIKDIKGIGAKIVYKACAKPFIQILVNAGYEKSDAQIIAKELVNGNGFKNGYDIEKMKVTNLVKKGIIDPVKVTRLALENAASVAGTILLTECTIVDDESEDKKTPAMDPMSMMGGM
jgi:chaperonin GroEL